MLQASRRQGNASGGNSSQGGSSAAVASGESGSGNGSGLGDGSGAGNGGRSKTSSTTSARSNAEAEAAAKVRTCGSGTLSQGHLLQLCVHVSGSISGARPLLLSALSDNSIWLSSKLSGCNIISVHVVQAALRRIADPDAPERPAMPPANVPLLQFPKKERDQPQLRRCNST